jgi:hypothetical protein
MAALKGINVIRRWVIQSRLKEQGKQGGVMITLPPKKFVDLNTSITADRLLRSGIDIDQLKTVGQVDNLINQINKRSVISQDDPRFQGIMNQLMGKKGEVFDMEGKKIPPGSRIMGGKEVKRPEDAIQDLVDQKFGKNYFDEDVPPGSRGGKDDIAEPVQSAEESLKNMIMAENKKNIAAMKKRKMLDEAIDNQSPSLSGDRKVDADLVAEDLAERMGLVYDEMPTKERLKLYDEAYQALTKKKFDPPEDMAEGGIARIGLKDGMNRRTFMKIFSGLVALPIIGKVMKPLKVGKKVTQVPIIKTGDVPGKPEWFDQLVNKVILEGDEVTKRFATQERQVIHMKKIDDETTVMVTQDLNDGSIMVDIDDPIRNVMGQSGDDTSVQMMLKKNPGDESNPATADEFSFTEADMRNYMDGPDDYTTEFTENTVNKMKDLTSDLGKIKSYATGKKQTMKEFIESKKRQDKVRFAEDNPSEYAAERGPDIDYSDYEYASGGIAKMLGE